MRNSINLLPIRTRDQIKTELRRFKSDLVAALMILGCVIIGVVFLLANAVLHYKISLVENNIQTAQNTLGTYRPLINNSAILDKKYHQVVYINRAKINPNDVITYIASLAPQGITYSNFSFTNTDSFTITLSSGNYLDIAKFLTKLEGQKLKLHGVQAQEISYDKNQNLYVFTITGIYGN